MIKYILNYFGYYHESVINEKINIGHEIHFRQGWDRALRSFSAGQIARKYNKQFGNQND